MVDLSQDFDVETPVVGMSTVVVAEVALSVVLLMGAVGQSFFQEHLSPWIGRFFADLERAEAADFYRRVGMLGRLFMDVETEAFALPS